MDLPSTGATQSIASRLCSRVLAAASRAVKVWAGLGRRPDTYGRAELRRLVVLARDLLAEIDDATAQLGVRDAHEGLGQRQFVGGRQKVGYVGRRRRLLHAS